MRFPFEGVNVLGPHQFWRNHLRRLKFYNPALPVSVEHSRIDSPERRRRRILQLTFEGTDVQALKAILQSKAGRVSAALEKRRKEKRTEKERLTRMQALTKEDKDDDEEKRLADANELAKERGLTAEEEKEELARGQDLDWRDAPREGMKAEESVNDLEDEEDDEDREDEEEVDDEDEDEDAEEEEEEEGEEEEEDEMDEEDEVDEVENEDAIVELEAETEIQAEPSGSQTTETDAVHLKDKKVPNTKRRLRSRERSNDDVVLKVPQPPASTTKAANPPAPVYTRDVTLSLHSRNATAIWKWFRARTKCVGVPQTARDRRERREVAEQAKRSEEDRVRVKAGMDALRSKDVLLKRARAEAEKMRAEG